MQRRVSVAGVVGGILMCVALACGGSKDKQSEDPASVSDSADGGTSEDGGVSGTGSCGDATVLGNARKACTDSAQPTDAPFANGEAAQYCDCLYQRWATKLSCEDLASRDFTPGTDPDQCYCMELQRPYCDATSTQTQSVSCEATMEGFDNGYWLSRNSDGSTDVSCSISGGGGEPTTASFHYAPDTDEALLATCVLADFPSAGAKVTFQRVETDLDQPVFDPATLHHGGVTADLDYGNGTHKKWTLSDANPMRSLAGECSDSNGN